MIHGAKILDDGLMFADDGIDDKPELLTADIGNHHLFDLGIIEDGLKIGRDAHVGIERGAEIVKQGAQGVLDLAAPQVVDAQVLQVVQLPAHPFSIPEQPTPHRPVLKAFIAKEAYHGPNMGLAPDIVLGFNRGYRISWQSPLGGFPREVFEDNAQKWSGDHMAAPGLLPGIVLANRKITAGSPALHDLTATVLDVFGVEKPTEMIGENVLE